MSFAPSRNLPPEAAARRADLERRWGPWESRTTAQLLDVVAAQTPDAPYVHTEAHTFTYADIAALSGRIAAGLLSIGVKPGDHVAVDMANFPEAVALKFAVARIGAVSVSINFLLRHEELGYVLRQSRASVLITMDEFRGIDYQDCLDRLAPGWESAGGGTGLPDLREVFVFPTSDAAVRGRSLVDLIALGAGVSDEEVAASTAAVDPQSVSDLLYTSGTTGAAKGALLQHDAVVRTAYCSAYTRAMGEGYSVSYALPIYHVFGYVEAMLAVIFAGGSIAPYTSFDAVQCLEGIGRYQIDELMCVPAMTTVVLDEARKGGYDLSSLRVMFSSGAAHAPHLWQDMIDVLGVEQLFTGYGQTETTASTMCIQPGDGIERLLTSVGSFKLAGVAGVPELQGTLALYKAVHSETGEDLPAGETGELVVTGPIVTKGYWDKPEETAAMFTADGWMRTGDLGYIDEDGYLSLTGRKKESYRCGGELVIPGEVELVLMDFPGVKTAVVVGVPHPRMGEVGCAFVIATPGEEPDLEALLAYASTRLARFKVPALALFADVDEIPTTVTGRVKKFQLIERGIAALKEKLDAKASSA